jgi:hypothetical protein
VDFGVAAPRSIIVPAGGESVVEVKNNPSGALTVNVANLTQPYPLAVTTYALTQDNSCTQLASFDFAPVLQTQQYVTEQFIDQTTKYFVHLHAGDPGAGGPGPHNLLILSCAYGGSVVHGCETGTVYVGGLIEDGSGQPVVGLTAKLYNNGLPYSATSDSRGALFFGTPKATLPDQFTVSLFKTSYVPQTLQFQKFVSDIHYSLQVVTPEPVSSKVAVVEVEAPVHHLGDSNFSGTENSQFQRPDAESVSLSLPFDVDSASLAFAHAKLEYVAKGIECADRITINATSVYTTPVSPAGGGYGSFSIDLPVARLLAGANTISVKAVGPSDGPNACPPGGGGIDDFEMANLLIRFSN